MSASLSFDSLSKQIAQTLKGRESVSDTKGDGQTSEGHLTIVGEVSVTCSAARLLTGAY